MVRGITLPRPPARRRLPSPTLRLYLLTLIISVTAGCAATVETDIVVRDDDSAGVRYELWFQLPDDLPAEAAAEFDRQLEAARTRAQAELRAETQRLGIDPDAVMFRSFNEDGRLGLRVRIDPVPRQRLNAVLGSGGSEALFRRFAVDRERGRLTFTAELTGEHTLSAPPAAGQQFAAGTGVLREPLTVVVAVRLPGQVTSHNADRVSDDGALVWEGQPQARTLTAQANVDAPSMLPLLVAVIALVLAGGLFAVWRRRRGRVAARSEGSVGWSVTADDPAARGAAFPLAPAARATTDPTPPASPAWDDDEYGWDDEASWEADADNADDVEDDHVGDVDDVDDADDAALDGDDTDELLRAEGDADAPPDDASEQDPTSVRKR